MTLPANKISSVDKIKIICVSDTHNHSPGEGYTLPAGDVLIHAGDLTNQGDHRELEKAAKWIAEASYEVKIVIAGNHDLSLDDQYRVKHNTGWRVESGNIADCQRLLRDIPGVVYLQHEHRDVEIRGRRLRVFGSPYSIDVGKQNWAFQYTSSDAQQLWSDIPTGIDILVTHSPPLGVLDQSAHWTEGGCPALLERLRIVQPRLHVFGHHHEGRGAQSIEWQASGDTTITTWLDPGADSRKQSLLNLDRRPEDMNKVVQATTTFVNASIMKTSWRRSAVKSFNKPIVLSINVDHLATS